MAKSLRSKWRRKCKTIKRERYAVKELARLKKMLGIEEEQKPTGEEVMEIVSEQAIEVDASTVKKKRKRKDVSLDDFEPESSDEELVTVPAAKEGDKTRTYSTKTMRDQYGQYPAWLHRRKYTGGKKAKKSSGGGIRKAKKKSGVKKAKNKKSK